ncbi:MAG: hypothetical protein HY704_04955 [Gemmatimonadetes bacterium]|nr:hypothetical protein [Gemmatimonadota bacterium]
MAREVGESPIAEREAELRPELQRLLTELAATLRKHGMYPPGHPSLGPALDALDRQLSNTLLEGAQLTLNIGRDRFLVDGVASDPANILLAGLAARLHAHELLALTFRRGVQKDELAGLLGELAREPRLEGMPLGRGDEDALRRWPNIQIQPLRYNPLGLGGAEARGAAQGREGFWLGLAALPFSTDVAGADLLNTSPSEVADRIEERLGEEAVDRMIAVQLFRLAENLVAAEGEAAELVSRKMSELVFCLEPETLKEVVELGWEGGRLNRFLRDASHWMEADAVLELIRVAADGHDQVVAPWLLRIMSKLAMHAGPDGERGRSEADGAIRAIIRRMVDDWELEDPRSAAYAETLQRFARRTPGARDGAEEAANPVEPLHVVQLGLDLDEPSEAVGRATARMVEGGQAAALLDLLERAPGKNRVAEVLWQRISSPDALLQLLQVEPPDFQVLDRIIDHLGVDAASAMLEVLSTSRSRFVRRHLFDRLPRVGPEVLPHLVARLNDPRWYVVRNMLGLIRQVGVWPDGFDSGPYLRHSEARVRIEAFKLALTRPEERERAITTALRDADPRLVALALDAAEDGCPPAAEGVLVKLARAVEEPPEHRSAAIRALANLGSPRALATLVQLCLRRRWLFWTRLAPPSPPVLEAVRALAERWPGDRRAATVVRRATSSADPQLRDAVQGTGAAAGGRSRPPGAEEPGATA